MSVPVKDGVCPYGEMTTTTIFPTTVFDDGNGNGAQENETGGHTTSPNVVFPINTNNTEAERNDTEPVGSPDSEKTQTDSDISTRLIYISTGGTVGLLMLVTLVVFVRVRARTSTKDKEASRLTTGFSPLPSKGIPLSESPGSGVEEAEPEKYHTLDEMAMAAEPTAHVQEEFDDEGYIRFNDGDTRSSRRLWRDVTRIYRPLPRTPKPPNSEQNALDMSSDSPYIYPDRSHSPRSKMVTVADVSTYNSLSSIYHKILDGTLPAPPMTSGQGLSEISETRPKPRPHCRLVSSDDHTYLGLVNLRPGLDIFGDVTEVKLVRSLSGDLELVNTDDESLAFTDYYTRIQLIQQEDRVVSVIGVLEKPSAPRVESVHMESIEDRVVSVIGVLEKPSVPRVESAHIDAIEEGHEKVFNAEPVHFGIVEDLVEPNTYNSIPPSTTPDGTEITSGGEAGDPGEEDAFNLEIIYLGSLELAENTYLDPCDYMTFLDIEASCTSYDSDGYLIALNIDTTNISANDPPS
ncbi:hypothetical protein EGW08_020903 [Elysia chlorotica]|uniref:Uncharacterized protein n=1 Tax=Elysia chlorotica TaxID=188477 RepID=A0A3S0ZBS4_ELYCH|nr:hypothetical protein EGW08_020903 [Elysia chlorotica]